MSSGIECLSSSKGKSREYDDRRCDNLKLDECDGNSDASEHPAFGNFNDSALRRIWDFEDWKDRKFVNYFAD